MKPTVRVTLASPPDRNVLVAEVFLDDIQWAEIRNEFGAMEVELYARPDMRPWRIPLAVAIDALENARTKLIKRTTG